MELSRLRKLAGLNENRKWPSPDTGESEKEQRATVGAAMKQASTERVADLKVRLGILKTQINTIKNSDKPDVKRLAQLEKDLARISQENTSVTPFK